MFDNGFPFGVVRIREDFEGRLIWQEAIEGGDVVVIKARDGKEHCKYCSMRVVYHANVDPLFRACCAPRSRLRYR